jgi:hypothetical protein
MEVTALENNAPTRGVILSNTTINMIEKKGDFEATIEGCLSMIQLAALTAKKKHSISMDNIFPRLNPLTLSYKLLESATTIDFSLVQKILHRFRTVALLGNRNFTEIGNIIKVPYHIFMCIVKILSKFCFFPDKHNKWVIESCVSTLAMILLGVAVILKQKHTGIPSTPSGLVYTINGKRSTEIGSDPIIDPFLELSNTIARYPKKVFNKLIKEIKYKMSLSKPNIDPLKGIDIEETRAVVSNWAVVPYYATCSWSVKNSETQIMCNKLIHEFNNNGEVLSQKVINYLKQERQLITN